MNEQPGSCCPVLGVSMGIMVVPRECLLLTLNPASKGRKLGFELKLGFGVV